MITCTYCGSEIKRLGRCPACNYLVAGCLEAEHDLEPLTDEQQAVEDTLLVWFDEWEQERQEAEAGDIAAQREAEELRLFATGH